MFSKFSGKTAVLALTLSLSSAPLLAADETPQDSAAQQSSEPNKPAKAPKAPQTESAQSESAKTKPVEAVAQCEKELLPQAAEEIDLDVSDTSILGESHSLRELVADDPAHNLVYKHPGIVMSAAQRVYSWMISKGEDRIPNPNYGGGQVYFNRVFSEGVGSHRIIGQHEAIETIVNSARAAARGDGTRSKLPILEGPPGTGKTEFQTILGLVSLGLTSMNSDYFLYTYEWTDLKDYPELFPYLNIQPTSDSKELEHPIPAALNDSPYLLLPKAYQKPVVQMAKDRVQKLIGLEPQPFDRLNSKCQFIRDTLLRAEMKKRGVTRLTAKEELEILAKHVRVKRLVVGAADTLAKINAEGKDIDWQGLFMSPNAFFINTLGPGHPMAYNLNGKILKGSGSVVYLDEMLRNEQALRDAMLEVIENKQVTRGGAPVVAFDAFLIGASNSESFGRVKADGQSRAHIDRMRIVPMPYSLNPYEISETMLLMKNPNNIYSQKLEAVQPTELASGMSGPEMGDELGSFTDEPTAAPIPQKREKAEFADLFPLPRQGESPKGPDGRYSLWVSTGTATDGAPTLVHISPHTLLYMSQVISASRMSTDVGAAIEINANYAVVNKPVFRDLVTRQKLIMKRISGVTSSELKELEEVSKYLGEGNFGISARDAANVWLAQAIEEAAKPANKNCLTPDVARRVFLRLLSEEAIQYPDNKTRMKWITIADEMARAFLVPSIQTDVHKAIASGLGAIRSIYEEVVDELREIANNPGATTYEAGNGEIRPIQKARLNAIYDIYAKINHRAFDVQELIGYLTRRGANGEMYHALEEAITRWLSSRSTELVSFDDIERVTRSGDGSAEARAKTSEFAAVMQHRLGYCPHCLEVSIGLAKAEAARKGPNEDAQQK